MRQHAIDLDSGLRRISDTEVSVLPTVPPPSHLTTSSYVRYGKPVLDRLLGTIGLLLMLPLLLVVAIAVRLSLGPGILYSQQRVGLRGKPFTMHKFRTMRPDRRVAQTSVGIADRRVCHKRDDDPRHTTVGRILRKFSLDELPQLWNVVCGQMSLVGPRPELVEVVRTKYEPWQHRRHYVKPGITGLWQVSARGEGLMYTHTDVDLEYLERLSLRTDLRILAMTVPAALGFRPGE